MKMKHFSSIFSLALLVSVHQSQAICNSPEGSYIDLSQKRSNLAQVVAEISSWDEDKNSPICQLDQHITDGYSLAFKDAVMETLAYAESLVAKRGKTLSYDQALQINDALALLADTINSGDLSVIANEEDVTRSKTTDVKEKVKFFEDVKFKDEVKFEDHVEFKHFVSFHGNVKFRKNVEIDGTLSVTDLVVASCIDNLCVNTLSVTDLVALSCVDSLCVGNFSVTSGTIGCDLSVGCNISMVDSIDSAHGNVIKNGNPFIHTFPGSASANTFVGENAANFTMTGTGNSVFGNSALGAIVAGSGNTVVGYQAMLANTTGNNNTAIGNNALNANVTGDRNIAIGNGAGTTLLTGNDNIYIVAEGAPAESGTIRIGIDETHVDTYIQGIYGVGVSLGLPVQIDLNGHLGTMPSKRSLKTNIEDMAVDSEGIYSLRPVTFSYKSDAQSTKQYGLIAEEVAEIFPSLIAPDRDGKPFSVRYQVLPMLLLNEVQKHHASIEALTARVADLEQRN